MSETIYVNGIAVTPPKFVCNKCGHDKLSFKWVEGNKSIQMRCENCEAWAGNYKYDLRPKEQIRREKIAEWKAGRKI